MESKPIAIVVDDNEDLNAIFSSALENAGYIVHSVSDSNTIKELLNEVLPTIITLDLHMPGMSGEKVLEYIRSQPRLDEVRVIVTTAAFVKVGKTPTATTADVFMAANVQEVFQVQPGWNVSAIQSAAGGNLHVTELTH